MWYFSQYSPTEEAQYDKSNYSAVYILMSGYLLGYICSFISFPSERLKVSMWSLGSGHDFILMNAELAKGINRTKEYNLPFFFQHGTFWVPFWLQCSMVVLWKVHNPKLSCFYIGKSKTYFTSAHLDIEFKKKCHKRRGATFKRNGLCLVLNRDYGPGKGVYIEQKIENLTSLWLVAIKNRCLLRAACAKAISPKRTTIEIFILYAYISFGCCLNRRTKGSYVFQITLT